MRTSLLSWSSLSAVVSIGIAACAAPFEGASSSSVCEANPEVTARPNRIAVNGASLNGQSLNGQNLNGTQVNRLATNRIAVNGQSLNGLALNGQNLNGQNLNGQNLNGQNLNGQNLNRIALNGQNLNGQNLNGTSLNGQNLNGVLVDGAAVNELVATTADGRLISGEALVGATLRGVLTGGGSIELTVSSFTRAGDPAMAYYRITHAGENICPNGEDGMFLPGVWDGTAARHDRLDVGGTTIDASFSCRTGVLAKCVSWGYVPWTVGADLHQACTRMTRADYCGTGVAYTKDDTTVDIFDTRGIQPSTTADASLVFEAGWGPDGAVCVSRTRYAAATVDGRAAMPACWSELPKCSSFDAAGAAGAVIGNASRIQSRLLCE